MREAAAAPAKKGGKARAVSAEVTVKDDWLVEHASQVARMLPGGAQRPFVRPFGQNKAVLLPTLLGQARPLVWAEYLLCTGVDVVGLYVFCSEAAYARAAPQLCRALDQMATGDPAHCA